MRRNRFLFFFGMVFLAQQLNSAPSLETIPAAIPFFRSKSSSFPSGYASQKALENSFLRKDTEKTYQVYWNKKSYQMAPPLLLLEESLVPSSAPSRAFHKGKIVAFVDTFLKERPSESATTLTTVPRLTQLEYLALKGPWAQIQYQGLRGFALIENFAHRGDFASWAYHQKRKAWVAILYRQQQFLVTRDQEKFLLDEFLGFFPQPGRALSLATQDDLPPLRAVLQVARTNHHPWKVSFLSGHGEVYWQPKDAQSDTKTLSTEDLFRQRISSFSLNEQSPVKGLASSESGVYLTRNGKEWEQMELFLKQSHPVHINSKGHLFVGPYRSTDNGKTFENYVRWDKIAKAVQDRFQRGPRSLRIEEIQTDLKNSSGIHLWIHTGTDKLLVLGNLKTQDWYLAPSNVAR